MGTPATTSDNAAAPAVTLPVVLAETIGAARAARREDLVPRLEAALARVRDPRRRIVVTGMQGQGKSRFVNALLDVEICPVGDDVTTTAPMVLSASEQVRAELVLAGPQPGDEESRVEVAVSEIGSYADPRASTGGRRAQRWEVGLPNRLLADGIVVVDTPAMGGHGAHGAATVLGTAQAADAVLFVTDASTELTEPELGFLRQLRTLCPTVAVLLTKIDLYPQWRRVHEADVAHLRREGLEVPIIPVSALLRAHALRSRDAQLGQESGYGLLYGFLREQVVARDQAATRKAVSRDIRSAAEHLALALGSELVALRDPDRGALAVRELRSARDSAQDLQRRTSAWQQTLADGITDLVGDIDHDLRDRLRGIARVGEEWIDENDPGRHWEEIDEWLTGTVDSALADNLLWTHQRALALAERVAEHFAEVGAVDLPEMSADASEHAHSGTLADLEPDIGVGGKLLVGMRGSYGGILMVGLASTFAGLAMLNPISLGAGIIVGGKAFRDDKQARLARRRGEAKTAVRRFVDDVAFRAAKDSKDRLHRIHRALRDHYAGVAERSLRSIDESLRAAQEAAGMESARRAERVGVLEQQLRMVAELRRYADLLHGSDAGTVAG